MLSLLGCILKLDFADAFQYEFENWTLLLFLSTEFVQYVFENWTLLLFLSTLLLCLSKELNMYGVFSN